MSQTSYSYDILLKAPRRFRPNQVILRDIKRYQRTSRPIIEQPAWTNLCDEVLQDIQAPKPIAQEAVQLTDEARTALQYAAEDYLTKLFRVAGEQRDAVGGRESVWSTDIRDAAVLEAQELVAKNLAFKRRRRKVERAHRRQPYAVPDWEWKAAVHVPEDAEEDRADVVVFE
jgi:hypothetical protein